MIDPQQQIKVLQAQLATCEAALLIVKQTFYDEPKDPTFTKDATERVVLTALSLFPMSRRAGVLPQSPQRPQN